MSHRCRPSTPQLLHVVVSQDLVSLSPYSINNPSNPLTSVGWVHSELHFIQHDLPCNGGAWHLSFIPGTLLSFVSRGCWRDIWESVPGWVVLPILVLVHTVQVSPQGAFSSTFELVDCLTFVHLGITSLLCPAHTGVTGTLLCGLTQVTQWAAAKPFLRTFFFLQNFSPLSTLFSSFNTLAVPGFSLQLYNFYHQVDCNSSCYTFTAQFTV